MLTKRRASPTLPNVEYGFEIPQQRGSWSPVKQPRRVSMDPGVDLLLMPKSQVMQAFVRKCQQASVILDFSEMSDQIHQKTTILKQIVKFLNYGVILPEECLDALFAMLVANLDNRTFLLESSLDCQDPSWAHISLVYGVLSLSLDVINDRLVHIIVKNTVSQDSRERGKAVQAVYSIYKNISNARKPIRSSIMNLVADRHCSSELIQFLESLAAGLVAPLREEHITFFRRAVLPIFRLNIVCEKLTTSIVKYLIKDGDLYPETFNYILCHFPVTDPTREVFFIDSVRYIFTSLMEQTNSEMAKCMFKIIRDRIISPNSNISLASLEFMRDESMIMLLERCPSVILEILESVRYAKVRHWNGLVRRDADATERILTSFCSKIKVPKPRASKQYYMDWGYISALARQHRR